MKLFNFLNNKHKATLFCDSNDESMKIIELYAKKYNKKILQNKQNEDNLCNQNIVILKDFNIHSYAKYDIKIFIVMSYEEYESNLRNLCNLDFIVLTHKIKYGYMQLIYDTYINNPSKIYKITDLINDSGYCKDEEYILIHTSSQTYFAYEL